MICNYLQPATPSLLNASFLNALFIPTTPCQRRDAITVDTSPSTYHVQYCSRKLQRLRSERAGQAGQRHVTPRASACVVLVLTGEWRPSDREGAGIYSDLYNRDINVMNAPELHACLAL